MRVNGTLFEDKMRRFKGECEHFSFNKCPIYTHDGASAKFSTNLQEVDNSGGKDLVIEAENSFSFGGERQGMQYLPCRVGYWFQVQFQFSVHKIRKVHSVHLNFVSLR